MNYKFNEKNCQIIIRDLFSFFEMRIYFWKESEYQFHSNKDREEYSLYLMFVTIFFKTR